MRRSTMTSSRHYGGRNEGSRRYDNTGRNAHYSGGGGGGYCGGSGGGRNADDGARPHFSGHYNYAGGGGHRNDHQNDGSNRSGSSKMRNFQNFSNNARPTSSSAANCSSSSRMRHSDASYNNGGNAGNSSNNNNSRGWSDTKYGSRSRQQHQHHNGQLNSYYDSPRNHVIKEEKRHDHSTEEKHKNLKRFQDWSEQVSKGGKKYYYNCKTEISQWEKPPEWVEWEKRQQVAAKFGSAPTTATDDRGGRCNDRSDQQQQHQRVKNSSPSVVAAAPRATGSQHSSNTNDGVDLDRLPHLLVEIAERHKIDLSNADALEKIKQHLKTALQEPISGGGAQTSLENHHEAILSDDEYENEEIEERGTKSSSHERQMMAHDSTDQVAAMDEAQENMDSTDCGGQNNNKNRQQIHQKQTAATTVVEEVAETPLASLSDSHALFYKEQMTAHIRDWAATHFENQAHNLCERSFQTSLEVAQVSADLKCARSLVRTAEIRSTLLDQRISYLRKQYYQLEALSKPSSSSSILSHT